MTNKDLYRALSDVDPDMVLDAQPAPKRSRPVWAKAVAIAACACLTVGVLATLPFVSKWAEPDTPIVPGETVTPEQTEQQTEVPTAGQVIGDPIQGTVFLYVPSTEEKADTTIQDHFSPSNIYGVYTEKVKYSQDEYVGNEKISPVSGKTLRYNHTEAYLKTSLSNEYGTYYSLFDKYKNDSETIVYLHGTDQIAFYSIPSDSDSHSPKLTEDQVKMIAEEFILNIISEENFANFKFIQMSIDPLNRYSLLFMREINGYYTDETISIWVDMDGTVSAYNGYNVGKYDTLADKLTVDKLDNACQTLIEKIRTMNLKNLTMHYPVVITSSTGEIFIKIPIYYGDEYDIGASDIVIINVE